MNLDQQYSKYFGGSNQSPRSYQKNPGFLDCQKEQKNIYSSQGKLRPFSNQNTFGTNKKDTYDIYNKRNNQDDRIETHYVENKPYSGAKAPTKNYDSYRNKGIGLTNKYRPNSNDKAGQKQDIERNYALKSSQSQGQLLKRNYQKSRDQKIPASQFQGRKINDGGQKPQLSQYKKLYDKLDSLQNKLAAMKINLEKKKAEKETAIEKSQKQRKLKQLERQKRAQQKSQSKLQKSSNPKQGSQNILKGIVTQMPKHNRDLQTFDHNPYSPRHNMYYVSEITRAYKEQKSIAREHLLTSIQLLKIMDNGIRQSNNSPYSGSKLNLSKKECYKDKKTVVFDLDQTLIHCNQTTSTPHDVTLPITFPTGEVIEAGINIRPHAVDVLKALAANFQVIIFTASHSCYANVVLDHLDPQNKLIQHRLYREHCHVTPEGMHVKDLRVLNRELSELVLIDNAAYSYAYQLDNGIPIIPYYEGKNDFELKALQVYLQRLIWVPDVREVNKKVFKLHQYRNFDDPQTLVQDLYKQWIV